MSYSFENALKKKIEKQTIAVKASYDHQFLFLEWFTGMGKSLAALRILKEHTDGTWVIVVKELNHKITWADEAKKWKISLKNVEMITYHSLHKLDKKAKYNFILDETHAITPARLKKLKVLKINRIVALTATMPGSKKFLINKLGKFSYYPITMAKAIEEKMAPEPTIYQVMLTMTKTQRLAYDRLSYGIAQAMNADNQDLASIIGGKRKRLIASWKTSAIKKRLDFSKRFVCFTGSIEQCDKLGGKNVVHSETKDRIKVIENFNKLKTQNLFAVNMLRESMNLVNIDVGYIGQLDNQEKSFIQMLGRSFRSTNPIVYVFTYKDSVDEYYARTAFANIPEKYVKKLNG